MNYGKLTAGTTKTAIDTAKPSEKGEIITYLSRMGDVLDDVEERGKIAVLLIDAVDPVANGDEAHIHVGKHNLGVKAYLEVVPAETGHIPDNDCPDLSVPHQ